MQKHIKHTATMKCGFSLVELSIVLVILGLLVGGVLSGQALIRGAELRKITTTQDKYRTAMTTFRDKYFALPSDMTNSTAFWGTKTATSCTNNSGAALNAATGTCDGNGDGFVYNATGGNDEYRRVWEQLSRAGLIEGAYAYSSSAGLTEAQALGIQYPALGLGQSGAIFGYVGVVNGVSMAPATLHGSTGHFLHFGVPSSYSSGLVGGMIKAEEAYNIDTKIDDGRPGTGSFLAHYDPGEPSVLTTRCVTSFNNSNANYNLTFTNKGCNLWFRVN